MRRKYSAAKTPAVGVEGLYGYSERVDEGEFVEVDIDVAEELIRADELELDCVEEDVIA